MAGKKKHMHVQHHKDKSHTVHHQHEGREDVKHAVANLDGVHDSLQDNLGSPNPGEAAANAGDHGVPAAQAEPAGLPAAAAGAPAGGGMPPAGM